MIVYRAAEVMRVLARFALGILAAFFLVGALGSVAMMVVKRLHFFRAYLDPTDPLHPVVSFVDLATLCVGYASQAVFCGGVGTLCLVGSLALGRKRAGFRQGSHKAGQRPPYLAE